MSTKGSSIWEWTRTIVAILLLAIVPAVVAILSAPYAADAELRKAVYTGAVTLIFAGLLGGMVKAVLDDVAAAKRKREEAAAAVERKRGDAATFTSNVLSDLKSVYDRVARARIVIPAHQSVQTYGNEMRDLIEAQVQLRNVMRALERRADGVDDQARSAITKHVRRMEKYLETLTAEFRDNYKDLSDKQRAYEERSKVLLKQFAEGTEQDPPELPRFVWEHIAQLPHLKDFIGVAELYKTKFEKPLDAASELLRNELARILDNNTLSKPLLPAIQPTTTENRSAQTNGTGNMEAQPIDRAD